MFPARDWDAFEAHWTRILGDETVRVRTVLREGAVAGSVVGFVHGTEREVGYWIGREFGGRGITTRALSEFLAIEPTRPLVAYVARHNVVSLRVLRKCGFRNAGAENESHTEGDELLLTLGANGGGEVCS